ncbi:U-box domain-containing protein 18-like [Salvia divinorum]|uniref:RING-type E3 ubiquitin transferase n=1 Tax=Salvia divinorum TaxID=28513 RepID=A0ABD1G6I6_SALDI
MLNNSDEFHRRILNLPAIRPCESVSFPTLLTSLINLGRSICRFKSKTFFTNKPNAANSIRLIEALLIFLEDLLSANAPPRSESSTALCLSELHFIFQKLRFLLEDCARDDARLLMLVKSEEASTHFRVLISAVAVALDVIPAPESGAGEEALEVAELVRKQAARSSFQVGRDDRRAMRRVLRVTSRLGRGIAPEPVDLRRALDDLKIGSWGECNDEIKCLESELGRECGTNEKREAPFIGNLIAFLTYCRCTVFLSVERSRKNPVYQELDDQLVRVLKCNDFRCPITLEIMCDPVTLSTGQTYERSSILKWFGSGNRTCPVTGEKLTSVDLVPNLALKRLIMHKFQENRIKIDESRKPSTIDTCSVAAEQAMTLLANFLVGRLVIGTNEEQNKAVFEIRLLTKTSNFNRSCLVEADAIPSLLDLIRSTSRALQHNAMAALLNLSKCPRGQNIIMENRGLDITVEVLNSGLTGEARQHAAGVLFYLSSVEDNRRKIGRAPGAIQGLMGVLNDGEGQGKKSALAAFLGLLVHPENHWRVLAAGLAPHLVNMLRSSENGDLVADSLKVLAALVAKVDGAVAIVSAGILPIIVQILGSSNSKDAREYSVSLLLSLCSNDMTDVVPILVRNSTLMVSLYSLISDGSPRTSKKAASLIRILHAFNEKSSSSLAQEQFVRVW